MPSALRNVIYKMFKISAQGLTDKLYSLKINISRGSGPQLTFALVFTWYENHLIIRTYTQYIGSLFLKPVCKLHMMIH